MVAGFEVAELNVNDRSIPVIIASHRTLGAYKRLKDLGFETVVPFAFLGLGVRIRSRSYLLNSSSTISNATCDA